MNEAVWSVGRLEVMRNYSHAISAVNHSTPSAWDSRSLTLTHKHYNDSARAGNVWTVDSAKYATLLPNNTAALCTVTSVIKRIIFYVWSLSSNTSPMWCGDVPNAFSVRLAKATNSGMEVSKSSNKWIWVNDSVPAECRASSSKKKALKVRKNPL